MRSSLEHKIMRPGFSNYTFYHSSRQQYSRPAGAVAKPTPTQAKPKHGYRLALLVLFLLAFGAFGIPKIKALVQPTIHRPVMTQPKSAAAGVAAPINHCVSNTLAKAVDVSISQRHMWACEGRKSVYDSPVITGIDYLVADKTPTGTYRIYSKQTNLTLTGSDSTGSWSDPVSYWLPYLDNQYGTYGFHDATWRPATAFGNIDPSSSQGSHGCVELPLATAQWLYGWASVGTTVTIES